MTDTLLARTAAGAQHAATAVPRAGGPIVVGTDGSPSAERALQVAARLGRALGVEVVAVHAVGMMTELDGQYVPTEHHVAAIDHRFRERWCAPLAAEPGLAWRGAVQFGDPAQVLMRTAQEVDAAFVVVGSRGHGQTAPELLGSTSHYVVHHSDRPVVVVPSEKGA